MVQEFFGYLTALSNVITIVASGIAIYLFVTQRESISSAFSLLVNYSFQLSLSELKEKMERLNDFHVDDEAGREQIIILLNETIGQIKGNDRLRIPMSDLVEMASTLASDRRRLTEPKKRAFVAELREKIRHIDVKNIENFAGVGDE